MKPQETKFTFVYNEIRQCILEAKYRPEIPCRPQGCTASNFM